MRISLKVLSGIVALLLVAVAGIAVKFYVLLPRFRPAPVVQAPRTPEAIARGAYLANHVNLCMACHSQVEENKPGEPIVASMVGSGREFPVMPGFFPGVARAPNLTPDPEFGLGRWTDGEILRAMREGVSKDGRPLFPFMPYLTFAKTMSDRDALAVIAYLRSLKPIHSNPGLIQVDFPASMFSRAAPRPLDGSASEPPASGVEHGRWILQSAHCTECHSPVNERHEFLPGRYLSGGTALPAPGEKGWIYARNLTSDAETGLGKKTDEQILVALSAGMGTDGKPLYWMPWTFYGGMTQADKTDLIAALREVPPVRFQVPPDSLPATLTDP